PFSTSGSDRRPTTRISSPSTVTSGASVNQPSGMRPVNHPDSSSFNDFVAMLITILHTRDTGLGPFLVAMTTRNGPNRRALGGGRTGTDARARPPRRDGVEHERSAHGQHRRRADGAGREPGRGRWPPSCGPGLRAGAVEPA